MGDQVTIIVLVLHLIGSEGHNFWNRNKTELVESQIRNTT